MTIAEALLAEFEQELIATRKHLERVPEDKLDWKPAEKSMTLGELSLHLATCQGEIIDMAIADEVPMPQPEFPKPANVAEILTAFDEGTANVRQKLPTITDDQCMGEVKFMAGDEVAMAFPRMGMLRTILMNHTYHHRGQMSVYLRELGVPVPSTYGPSADEAFMPQPANT